MEKLVSFLFVVFSVCAFGQTPKELFEVYPGPKGIAPSKKYQVSVSQNNLEKPSFVYYSTPLDNDEDNAEKDNSKGDEDNGKDNNSLNNDE